MASNLNVPESLKQIRPYLTLAGQLDQKNELCIGYYCRLYSVQKGMEINKSAPECKKFLIQLMDLLEALKKKYPNDESIHSEVIGQACVEKYALRIFEKADDDDRKSLFSKNLVKQFYTSGLLFDILNCFGELSEDLVVKKQYAKRKAMYLNKCFQIGETPIPGPLVGENFDSDENKLTNEPDYSNLNIRTDQPVPSSIQSNYEDYQDQASGSLSVEVSQKAQKLCKYAQSALQYDDVSTAIKNLEECLALLKK